MRSMEKAIQEYHKRFSTTGDFYFDDVRQIKEMSEKDGRIDPYDLIFNALQAGFMIGYRTAERHCKPRMERK